MIHMISGSLLNFGTIVLGSSVGLLIKFLTKRFSSHAPVGNSTLTERIRGTIMQGVALCVLLIGISGALNTQNILIAILSIAVGSLLGELLNLDRRLRVLGDLVQKKTERVMLIEDGEPTVAEGFVSASLLFCVGAMAIVGALENGLTGASETLQVKSLLDSISSIVLASSLGAGVLLSAISVLLYQGSISLLASLIAPILSDVVITEMSGVGSLLIIALALNMLGITKIRVMNMVPAIFLPMLFCFFM